MPPSTTTLPPPLRPHALAPRGDVAYVPEFVSEKEEEALLRHLKPTATAATATTKAAAEADSPAAAPAALAPGWKLVSGRRLRVLGGSVDRGALTAAPLPSWLLPLIERLRLTGAYAEREGGEGREATKASSSSSSSSSLSATSSTSTSTSTSSAAVPPPPNHALVNCYGSGEGILPHEDGPLYHPAAAIVSLGSWAVLRFYSKRRDDKGQEEKEEDDAGEKEEEKEREERDQKSPRTESGAKNVFSVALAPRSLVVFTGEAYTKLLHGIEAVAEERLDASVLNREDERVLCAASKKVVSSSDGGGGGECASPLRVIPRGGVRGGCGDEEGGENTNERISLTVRRVLRVRRNLLRLGPR